MAVRQDVGVSPVVTAAWLTEGEPPLMEVFSRAKAR